MDEEWRVSILSDGHAGWRTLVRGHDKAIRNLLRARLGNHIAISASKNKIFLYTTRFSAAEEVAQVARDVLTQLGLSAQLHLEYWDAAARDWRDPDVEPQEETSQDDDHEPSKLRAVTIGVLSAAAQAAIEVPL